MQAFSWLEAYNLLDRPERERLTELGRPGAPGLHGDDIPAFLWDNRIAAIAAMPLGELWRLDELADDCAADGVYETLLVSEPLNLRGGAGSPANALALK